MDKIQIAEPIAQESKHNKFNPLDYNPVVVPDVIQAKEMTRLDNLVIFLNIVIFICCVSLFFIQKYPGFLMACLSIIPMFVLILFCVWVSTNESTEKLAPILSLLCSTLLIGGTSFYCLVIIKNNATRIRDGNFHPYYNKFMLILTWIIIMQCILYVYIYMHKKGVIWTFLIICYLSMTSYIINYFNSFYFQHYSADG